MNYTETLTRYVANFVDELYRSGLSDVVISPGSRSTPLALTFAEHSHINHWVNMDERSAAFFALGMAKKSKQAVALVCTSGTAAANYYPAIIEAYYSRVPLVVLTADRPHELRDVGAPQAIEQLKMYGEYVKWFHEMALPEGNPTMIDYVRTKASRAVGVATMGNQGPVHLNLPVREPLIPDFSIANLWGEAERKKPYHYKHAGELNLAADQIKYLVKQIRSFQRGLIVCGPQEDPDLAAAIVALSEAWGLPILADPLSQLRAGDHSKTNIIESHDSILKSKQVRDLLHPDFIIRFGAMPVSKPYLLFLKEKKHIQQYIVEAHEGHREPTGAAVDFIFSNPVQVCKQLSKYKNMFFDSKWMDEWMNLNHVVKHSLLVEEEELSEGLAVKYLIESVPDDSTIYVGNSMPIRDMDTFFTANSKRITVLGNRGANGIDGITSSALGAATLGSPVTLLIGDLSFFHDFNALMIAKQYNLNLTVVLINNNGGGIFSFLPQANDQSEHFEVLFGTPLHIDFKHIVTMYGGDYHVPKSWTEFHQFLTDSFQHKGLSVIELQTDREKNVKWHRQKWSAVEKLLLEQLRGE